MSNAYIPRWRIWFIAVGISLCFGGILWRLYYLHILEQDNLVRIVATNRNKLEILSSRRGKVVDSRGNLLATTNSVIELGVDPQGTRTEDLNSLPELAHIINMPLEELESRMLKKTRKEAGNYSQEVRPIRWSKLADSIGEETYKSVRALGIKGVYGNRKFERLYPGESLASHLMGFINKEGTPVMGVERYMDFYLRGQDGWRETEYDGLRRELARFRKREVEPTDGLNIELTIDFVVQHIIEDELKKLVEKYQPESATVIVSDPSTGYLMGLANWPTFDLNEFWKYPLDWHRNRAVSDIFEPGSTFKIVSVSGALNESLVQPDTLFDCNQPYIRYHGKIIRLPRDHKPHGVLTVSEVVSKSSNRGAAQLGMLLGPNRLYDYCVAFGFGDLTGYPLEGEVAGILHPVRKWDSLTISRLPIGHAVSATPLQIHYAMSVIANKGVLMSPQIVRRVFDAEGQTLASFRPKTRHRAIREETASEVSQFLIKTVSPNGTAPLAIIPDYEVAGKTGTTRKIINGRYTNQHHVTSFVGFFPASKPRLVITVVVDDPQSEMPSYGGKIAAPVFKSVAQKLIQYLEIEPVSEKREYYAMRGLSYESRR